MKGGDWLQPGRRWGRRQVPGTDLLGTRRVCHLAEGGARAGQDQSHTQSHGGPGLRSKTSQANVTWRAKSKLGLAAASSGEGRRSCAPRPPRQRKKRGGLHGEGGGAEQASLGATGEPREPPPHTHKCCPGLWLSSGTTGRLTRLPPWVSGVSSWKDEGCASSLPETLETGGLTP